MKKHDHTISNFRDFLRNHAEAKQLSQPSWNYSAWAKALGLKSTSSLTKVLSGERKPGPKMVNQLVRYFQFTSEEESQFRNLILLSKDRNASLMAPLLSRSEGQEKSLQSRVLQLFEFRLIAEWQHLTIRELFRVKDLKLTSAKIKSLLKDELSLETIQKSLTLLKSLGLLKKGTDQTLQSTDEQIRTQNDIPDSAIQFYHEQKLDHAKMRLKDTDATEREFQALTLLIDQNDIPMIKHRMRKFIQTLESEIASKKVDRLYQFQMQLFPITETFGQKYEINSLEKPHEK